jgi:hypothetical protein
MHKPSLTFSAKRESGFLPAPSGGQADSAWAEEDQAFVKNPT